MYNKKKFNNAKTEVQISNTMKSIGKHLLEHEKFKTCYSDKIEFVENHLGIIKQKELQNRSNDLVNI